MSGPKDAAVRAPAFAGLFYPARADECRAAANSLVQIRESARAQSAVRLSGAIVPHAGWMCSGAIAGESIAALARSSKEPPDVIVVFGAIHTSYRTESAMLDTHDRWEIPGRECPVAADVRTKLRESSATLFGVDDRFHEHEHAVEVELPLIEAAWPGVAIVPVEVPAIEKALEIGRETAQRVQKLGASAMFLASSDLTHYGPAYRFTPHGIGTEALTWAKTNDRKLLDLVEKFEIERIVPEVMQSRNACGAGAIAAMMAACRELGATKAMVLRHSNSFEVLSKLAPQPPDNAVGYAAVVVG